MTHKTTVLSRAKWLFTTLPGVLVLVSILGGTAAATAPVFNGSIAVPAGGQITSSGAPTYPIVNLNITGSSATTTGSYPYNYFYINGDNVNDNVANGDLVRGLAVQLNTHGANVAGSRRAGYFEQDLTSTIATGTNNDYVGVEGDAYSPTAQSSPHPNLFGMFGKAQAANGGTGMNEVAGAEFDAEVDTGASAVYRWGVSTVSLGNVAGSSSDGGYELGASGGIGWSNGFLLDNIHGVAPIATTGCIFCTDGSADTVQKGIDLSAYTINGNALAFKNATLSGAGDLVLSGVLQVGAGKTISSQSGNLLVSAGANSSLAFNYNVTSPTTVFYSGTTSIANLNSSGVYTANSIQWNNPVSVLCSATNPLPCKFSWNVSISAGTSGTATQAVPTNATCTITPTSSMLVSSTNMGTVSEGLSGTTLTITVQTQTSATQSFGGVGTCI